MDEGEQTVRGKIIHILFPPVMFCNILDEGMKMKKLKANLAPKLRYSTQWSAKVTFRGGAQKNWVPEEADSTIWAMVIKYIWEINPGQIIEDLEY